MNSLLDSLNPKQSEAVCAADPYVLVLAGAGSGKTRVLTRRVAWLIAEKNLSPHAILAVTFTNKAANEMRHRIEQLIDHFPRSMWVGTFHGLAHRLLRQHWQEAGLPESFQILDGQDQLRFITRVMKEINVDKERWPAKQAQHYINHQKDAGLRASSAKSGYGDQGLVLQQVYHAYENLCAQSGLVDFAELLLRAYELLAKQPNVLAHYQQRFQHILVDEFQDTNTIQYNWLRLLTGADNHVTVVGDDDQSIYGWRGAKIENLHRFQKDFTPVCVVRLEQNYRSTGHILKAANALVAHNLSRMGKELWTDGGDGELSVRYQALNDRDEARFIINKILAWHQGGENYQDCAVLYRSNAQSRVIEEELMQMRIPYQVHGGLRFFDRAEIKDALAYLNLVVHPDNDAAFDRVVNKPTRGIGLATLQFVKQIASEDQSSLWKAAHTLLEKELLSARACNALQGFLTLIKDIRQAMRSLPIYEQVDHVLECAGLWAHYSKDKTEVGRMRVDNLRELIGAVREFEFAAVDDQDFAVLLSFLSHAALEAGEFAAEENADSVQLMTIHAAKGLEFPVVFLSGMEQGLFPSQRSLDVPEKLEEERRLCYVGMTRAMQKLYLTHARKRRLYGTELSQMPSCFFREIPAEHVEDLSPQVRIARPSSFSSRYQPVARPVAEQSRSSKSEERTGGFYLGQTIQHPAFGEGVILNFEGTERVQIEFASCGIKWLSMQFAHLLQPC